MFKTYISKVNYFIIGNDFIQLFKTHLNPVKSYKCSIKNIININYFFLKIKYIYNIHKIVIITTKIKVMINLLLNPVLL